MKHQLSLIILLFYVSFAAHGATKADNADHSEHQIVVFVNKDSDLQSLTKKQVTGFFLGRNRFSSKVKRVLTFDFPADLQVRTEFYEALTGKSISVIDAYLARLKYSGNVTLPIIKKDCDSLLEAVKSNEHAIAYGPISWFNTVEQGKFRIIYTLDVLHSENNK